MRKRRMWFWTLASILLLGSALTALTLLLKHEPNFYRRALVTPGQGRKDMATACMGRFVELVALWTDGKGDWEKSFSEAQLNSFFAEEFVRWGDADNLRRQGISEPRIVIEENRLRLAFRYGRDFWSTVISYDLKLWLAPRDANVICVEIQGRHAGAIPLAAQALLNEISETASRKGVEVTWYRHEGNPVALIRFQADRTRPTAQLRRLDVRPGMITLGGVSLEPVRSES